MKIVSLSVTDGIATVSFRVPPEITDVASVLAMFDRPVEKDEQAPPADDLILSGPLVSEQAPAEQPPAEPRQRRRHANPLGDGEAASEAPAPLSEATPTATSRRRRAPNAEANTAATPSLPASPITGITDADLSKAASEGARVLTPKAVMEYIAEFNVKATNELQGADRRKFIDGLRAKIEKAS